MPPSGLWNKFAGSHAATEAGSHESVANIEAKIKVYLTNLKKFNAKNAPFTM